SFFGTLLLIGERVFRIGDRIKVGDIEGIVEQVGFRSTRLRTDEGALLTVPNSAIASSAITNRGTRQPLQFRTAVEVGAETPAGRVLEFRDRLQEWLSGQPQAVRDRVECQVQPTAGGGVEVRVSVWLVGPAEEGRFREGASREIL